MKTLHLRWILQLRLFSCYSQLIGGDSKKADIEVLLKIANVFGVNAEYGVIALVTFVTSVNNTSG